MNWAELEKHWVSNLAMAQEFNEKMRQLNKMYDEGKWPKIPEKTPEQQIEIDKHVDEVLKKYTSQPKTSLRQVVKIPAIAGKTIAKIVCDGATDHDAEQIDITFTDGTTLTLLGEVGYEYNHPISWYYE